MIWERGWRTTSEPASPPPIPPLSSSGKRGDPKTAAAGKIGAALAGGATQSRLNLGVGGGDDGDTWKWWYYVLGGLAMVPVAFWRYFRLLDYENNEETSTGL